MKEIEKIRVVVDTNEKLNYSFKLHPKIQPISRHMESGDYCLENFENSVIIERKTISDILSCFTIPKKKDDEDTSPIGGRKRFERELARLRENCVMPIIMIEGNLTDLWDSFESRRSQIHVEAIIGSLNTWLVRYGVFPYFATNRTLAEATTARILTKAYEQITNNEGKYKDNWLYGSYKIYKETK